MSAELPIPRTHTSDEETEEEKESEIQALEPHNDPPPIPDPLDTELSEKRYTSLLNALKDASRALKMKREENPGESDDKKCDKYNEIMMMENPNPNKVMCPWHPKGSEEQPGITMLTWITLVMGMLEVQFRYIEGKSDVFVKNHRFKKCMRGQTALPGRPVWFRSRG